MKRKTVGTPLTLDYFRERSVVDDSTGCWLWTGAVKWNGYGAMRVAGKTVSTHRAACELVRGEAVPSSLDICHYCDVRRCVNPAHLFVGTRTDNMRDCANKGRIRTPCLEGDASPNSKLTAEQVLAIRASEKSNRQIARELGLDKGTIAAVRRRQTWRSI